MNTLSATRPQQATAWLVHLYTISGGLLATGGLFEVLDGSLSFGLLLLLFSRLIDSTDGLLARHFRVWEALPNFNGEMVDNLIDIYTYLWIPITIMWAEELLPSVLWLTAPIIGTMYVYGQTNMKSEDNFFVGFPSLWGVVVIYLIYLQLTPWAATLIVLIPSILCFIPIKYLYFSKNPYLRVPGFLLGSAWVAQWVIILLTNTPSQTLIYSTLYFPAFYFFGSLYATYRFRS